jgi:hypothetical protein
MFPSKRRDVGDIGFRIEQHLLNDYDVGASKIFYRFLTVDHFSYALCDLRTWNSNRDCNKTTRMRRNLIKYLDLPLEGLFAILMMVSEYNLMSLLNSLTTLSALNKLLAC